MTPDEAHQYAMDVVEELRASGIEVQMRPSHSRQAPHVVEMYAGKPGRASTCDLWWHVTFVTKSDDEKRQRIIAEQKKLCWMGITFDTGGGMGMYDWELDWSMVYREPGHEANAKHEEAIEILDDLLSAQDAGPGLYGGFRDVPDDQLAATMASPPPESIYRVQLFNSNKS